MVGNRGWESFTTKEGNSLLGRSGRFRHPGYFDRVIRDERHRASAVWYIPDNPVKAGLAERAEEWPFSSAAGLGGQTGVGETPALPS